MENAINALEKCVLTKNFSKESIEDFLKNINYTLSSYSKGEIIAVEEWNCSKIGIVIKGNVEVQKIFASGKTITISRLEESDIFGEVIIFSNRSTYPATIVSSNESIIMFISKEDILNIFPLFPAFLNNFMTLLSDKILMLNRKLKNISYETIRQKIAFYILEEYAQKKNLKIHLSYTRKEMAELLGIPRPSLSRELINMKRDNIIDFHRNNIVIKDLETLRNLLF
ncbi:Crp/Fnr family transcriptional regulator [Clostridium kluyveri]|uniref:Predicted transcriptional regulator n=2 Tax=Clostridium kluyveri TaxID=1534 RepID=A5MZY6_CLOK5|nr:Crp/Fnr family transcriptional regulator [Clostridium kluyveri]EDK34432.1 Predicted transcriptional regulator [Clostridium kluyveri DSM 555]BAH07186.1 hypothetical protein CKR_2135 [Clostridium kluyveri NBRC 12016]